MREFDTGATRDSDEGKIDYEGFLSPLVLCRFGGYMHKHTTQADGQKRAADNWQKGIPKTAYMKSAWRHFMDWWWAHRRDDANAAEEAICALLFNAQGYLHQVLSEKLGYCDSARLQPVFTPPLSERDFAMCLAQAPNKSGVCTYPREHQGRHHDDQIGSYWS